MANVEILDNIVEYAKENPSKDKLTSGAIVNVQLNDCVVSTPSVALTYQKYVVL